MDSKEQMDSKVGEKEIQWEVEREDSKGTRVRDQEQKGIPKAKAKGGSCPTGYSRDSATYVEYRGIRRNSVQVWDWDSKGNVNIVD